MSQSVIMSYIISYFCFEKNTVLPMKS